MILSLIICIISFQILILFFCFPFSSEASDLNSEEVVVNDEENVRIRDDDDDSEYSE